MPSKPQTTPELESKNPDTEQVDSGRRSMLRNILIGGTAAVVAAQPGCASVMRIFGSDKAVDDMVRKFKEKEGIRLLGAQTVTTAVNYGVADNFGDALRQATERNAEKLSTSEKKLTEADLKSEPIEGFARKLDDGRFIVFVRSSVKGAQSAETVKKPEVTKESFLKENGFTSGNTAELSDGTVAAYGEGSNYGQAYVNAISVLQSNGHAQDTSVLPVTKNFSGEFVVIVKSGKLERYYKERHERLTDNKYGTIHVWHPEIKGDFEGITVFVHGHKTANNGISADKAWRIYQLEEQFRDSGNKDLFITPDVPTDDRGGWLEWVCQKRNAPCQRDLNRIIEFVKKSVGVELKPGLPVKIVAHSGGFWTAAAWMKNPDVKQVCLLDALYGLLGEFRNWANKNDHKLILIASQARGKKSLRYSRRFMEWFRSSPRFNRTPETLSDKQKRSNVIYIESPYRHHTIPSKSSGIIPKILGYFRDREQD